MKMDSATRVLGEQFPTHFLGIKHLKGFFWTSQFLEVILRKGDLWGDSNGVLLYT